MKMAVADQIKILDRKIMEMEAQFDLERKAAKISASSTSNLEKYEYSTVKIEILSQALLNKQDLSILY